MQIKNPLVNSIDVLKSVVRPLLMGTKLLSETHESEFRWADLTKLGPVFRKICSTKLGLMSPTHERLNNQFRRRGFSL